MVHPRDTSLWSCLAFDKYVALGLFLLFFPRYLHFIAEMLVVYSGGDQSIYLPQTDDTNPTDSPTITTKSAVFSLAYQRNRLLAGTRGGSLLSVDPRVHYWSDQPPQVRVIC